MNAALTTNTTSTPTVWAGGAGLLIARGTFGSGTLAAQICDNNSSTDSDWVTCSLSADTNTIAQLTAAGTILFTAPPNFYIRVKLSGATSPSVAWEISGVSGRAASDA